MAAPQQNTPGGQGARYRRWVEPDQATVAAQIEAFSSLTNRKLAAELAAFIATDDVARDPVVGCAIRSPELVKKTRRLVMDIIAEPEKYLPEDPGEARNAYRRRLSALLSRAEHEKQLLNTVWAGVIARRGNLLPEPNPRGRARRRLADEYPVRFLELVREEEEADERRAAQRAQERQQSRDAPSQ